MTSQRQTVSLLLFCLLLAIVAELFTHCGSPFSCPLYEMDQQCFFMSAKAWWNGLLPYRDCSDVKGPLLYLFYMAGYWITPTSFFGVFLVQIVWSTLVFFVIYKTARLFLGIAPSLLALGLSLLSIYFPYYHDAGSRAEDVMLLPLAVLVYAVCRFALSPRDHAGCNREFLWLCALNGAVAWIFFFIKYNVCLVSVGVAAWLAVEAFKRGKTAAFLLATCLGGCSVLLPFLAYFLLTGTLGNLIDVYILLNRETFANFVSTMHWPSFFIGKYGMTFITTCLWLAGILFLRAPLRVKLPIGLMFVCTRLVSLGFFFYYAQICSYFGIFLAIALLQRLPALTGKKALAGTVLSVAVVVLVSARTNLANAFAMLRGGETPPQNPIERYLERTPNRNLMIINGLDPGLGTSSHQLPSGPYWFTLNGLPEWCKDCQRDIYRKRDADYILVFHCDPGQYVTKDVERDLERYGYRRVMEVENEAYSSPWRRLRVIMNSHVLYEKSEMAEARDARNGGQHPAFSLPE